MSTIAATSAPCICVRVATTEDEQPVISTLVTAFASDPAARWAWADPQSYLTHFPAFARAFGGAAFDYGTAHHVQTRAAALWLPPGVGPDEERVMELIERTVPDQLRPEVSCLFEEMGRYHPTEPHWYLPLIGVDTPVQGRGYGSALLEHAAAVCDRDGLPAYLESTNPRNNPLYERYGFEKIGVIQAGSSPPIYPMRREPRN